MLCWVLLAYNDYQRILERTEDEATFRNDLNGTIAVNHKYYDVPKSAGRNISKLRDRN